MNQSEANEEASNLIPNLHPPTSSPGLSPKKVGWRPTHFLREKPWGRGYPPPTPSQPLWDVNEEQRISRGKGKWKKKWKRTKAWFLAGKVLLKSVVKNLWGMVWRISLLKSSRQLLNVKVSLRSRRLEVVGTRKNGRARKRHACLPRARPVFLTICTAASYLPLLLIQNISPILIGYKDSRNSPKPATDDHIWKNFAIIEPMTSKVQPSWEGERRGPGMRLLFAG